MHFKYFFFCILLFYNTEAKLREVVCPDYCSCDVFRNFKRATCQSKRLVSTEIGMPPEVEIFDLSYNQISELGNMVFATDGLTELKLLNLSNNKISQIHMFAFQGIKNLKSLDLSFNIMEYFLEQWFSSWQNLQELYLQGNSLVLINKQPILNLPSLKILDLSQSKIEHFNPNIFSLLPKLKILDISANFIQRLDVEVIVPLTNLQLLLTKDNNLDCKDQSIRLLRHLIRKENITYIGPCIRKFRRIHTPITEGSMSIPSKSENSESVVQDGGNKELEKMMKPNNKLQTSEPTAIAGDTVALEKIGKSEKNLLAEDLDKTTDILAKYGSNENSKVLEKVPNSEKVVDKIGDEAALPETIGIDELVEKINKAPNSGTLKDKTSSELALSKTGEDGEVAEKFNKLQNSGNVEGVNKFDNTDKLAISNNLETINYSEILGDPEMFRNSDKFQKMKMESPSPINQLDISTPKNADKLSENNLKEKMEDDDFMDKLKNFLQTGKLKKVPVRDSTVKLLKENPTSAPETSDKKTTVLEINAWMVDDSKSEIDDDKSKNYVENCNGTKKAYFNNVLDKMAMEIIAISPSLILVLFTLFGIMLGLVLGCSVQIKEIPKFNKPNWISDLFKPRKPKPNEQDKNEMDQNEVKIPIQEDDILKEEDNERNESALPGDDEESDDCDICEEEREMLKERKDRNKKRPKSPFEDQTFLLDNELVQDGSTPMLGKKEFSETEDYLSR